MNAHRNADTLAVAGGRNVLTMVRRFPEPPGDVWAALVEPASLSRWFPFHVDLDPHPGGTIAFAGVPAEEPEAPRAAPAPAVPPAPLTRLTTLTPLAPRSTGTVTEVRAPRLFAFNWGPDHLSWTVAPDGDRDGHGGGSELTLAHTFGRRADAPTLAAGWDRCLAALGLLLAGRTAEPGTDEGGSHDAYVRRFGLDQGTVTTAGDIRTVRFERQLADSAERVWEVLAAGLEPVPGLPVPVGFTDRAVPAGPVIEVRPPHFLSYEWTDGGTVSWELGEGTAYGARLVLTQTGRSSFDTGTALAAWRTRIEELAARLRAA